MRLLVIDLLTTLVRIHLFLVFKVQSNKWRYSSVVVFYGGVQAGCSSILSDNFSSKSIFSFILILSKISPPISRLILFRSI